MADMVTARGMVISSAPIGENDKRVVLLTKELGKISAFVRGARRPGNSLMAAGETFAFGTFYLIEGRDSYKLVNAEIKEYFRDMVDDLVNLYTGYYMLELAGYYTVENIDCSNILNLIYVSFKALLGGKIDKRLIRYVYELKMLVINGEYPDFFRCVKCGKDKNLTGFSIAGNGVVCKNCAALAKDPIALKGSTLYILQYVAGAELQKLYTFTAEGETLTELRMVMNRCMQAYVDKKMNSLDILNSLY